MTRKVVDKRSTLADDRYLIEIIEVPYDVLFIQKTSKVRKASHAIIIHFIFGMQSFYIKLLTLLYTGDRDIFVFYVCLGNY